VLLLIPREFRSYRGWDRWVDADDVDGTPFDADVEVALRERVVEVRSWLWKRRLNAGEVRRAVRCRAASSGCQPLT